MARIPRLPTMAVLLLAAATTVAATTAVPPVGASCIGPMAQVPSAAIAKPLDRGQSLVVTGQAWGDNCYDTGVPPGGKGVLGNPLRNISIVFVQGDRRIVVARGSADRDYGFRVRITVPDALEPGPVQLVAHHGSQDVPVSGTRSPSSPPGTDPTAITVSSAPATGRPRRVAGFGPAAGAPASAPADQADEDPDPLPWAPILLGAIAVVGIAGGLVVSVARSRRSSPP